MRTGTAPPSTGGNLGPAAPFVQPPSPRARRQPALLALGVALIGMSAAGFVYWNQKADTKSSVLVVARDVAYGKKLSAADLRVSQVVLGPGVAAVDAGSMDKALTEVATTDLHAGALLTPADIGTAPPLPPGTELISFSVKADSIPPGVTTGRSVLLVAEKVSKASIGDVTGSTSAKAPPVDAYPSDPVTFKATVVAIDGTKLSVAVADADALLAQQLGADGKFGIVLPPVTGS